MGWILYFAFMETGIKIHIMMNTDAVSQRTFRVMPYPSPLTVREKTMEEFVAVIARSLVDRPEAVQVNTVKGQQISVIELKVAKEDLGKIIGKKGRTAGAMRTLLNAMSAKSKSPSVLEIVE